MTEWYFEPEQRLAGITGTGCRNLLEGSGLSRDEKTVRETIQNSVDALAEGSQRAKVIFRIKSIVGEEKRSFLEQSGLAVMIEARKSQIGLPASFDSDAFLRSDSPLPLLFIEDFGTTGLTGLEHTGEGNSNFYRFAYMYGGEGKAEDDPFSLGSYGMGKSVLSSASPVYAFFVHTVINPDPEEGVFARTIGCGLYQEHEFQGSRYSGRAWFGDTSGLDVDALQNESACAFAEGLGFTHRTPSDTGTSICIVGLDGCPDEYLKAISRSWWPRLVRNELTIEVIDTDGKRHFPRPMLDPQLKKYIEAYKVADGTDLARDEDTKYQKFRKTHLGRETGIVAAKRGLPLEAGEEPHDLDNKVALMRQKGMVVEYFHVSTSSNQRWYGVFLAHADCDEILKLSEPSAHNRWDSGSTRLRNKYGPEGKAVVDAVHQRIHDNIRKWFNVSRVPQQSEDRRVRRLDELFGRLFNAPGPNPPPPPPNPAPVHLDHLSEYWHELGDYAWITANPILRLKDDYETDSLLVSLRPTCRICEDIDLKPGEPISVTASAEGAPLNLITDGTYEIKLEKGCPIHLSLQSAEFDNRLLVEWRLEVSPK